jgi:hypothetical protein
MIGIPRSEWLNQAQWAITSPLLFASLAGIEGMLLLVIGSCALSVIWYLKQLRTARTYRVQVRLGFMLMVGLGVLPGLGWVIWIPAVGTAVQVLFGYCPMARILDLMPWNRSEALSWRGVARIVARRPGPEGVLSSIWTGPSESRLASATAASLLPACCGALREAGRQHD